MASSLSSLCLAGVARAQVLKWAVTSFHTSTALAAARKGTRAKADAKKKATKKVVVKREFVPLKKRLELNQSSSVSPRRIEDHLKTPIDDVWFTYFYKWKVYTINEAITMHRETHHPSQYNFPDALVNVHIELDMSTEKKNRFMEKFSNVVRLPHDFNTNQRRTILVIARSQEVQEQAIQMGATSAAGLEIVKLIMNGKVDLKEYDYFITEVDLIPELISLRGLMKKRFPAVRNGTASSNVLTSLERFIKGIEYESEKDKYHHDYATIKVPFGQLSMPLDHLENNLSTLLQDIEKQKSPKKTDNLITMALVLSPPSTEQFKIDHSVYLPQIVKSTETAAAVSM